MPSNSKTAPIPGLDAEKLLDCVHCGICLSACPTFDILGTEADSPRGRIYLMRGLAEGRIELDESIAGHFDTCLGCRACDTACPPGVPCAERLAPVKAEIERRFPRSSQAPPKRPLLLDMVTNPSRMS